MSLPTSGLEVHLVARPKGEPKPSDFAVVQKPLPELADGQVLVANQFMSVDPYMRGRMNDVKSYVPPYALDAVMDGGAVGTVLASRSDKLAVGDLVLSQLGWRQHAVTDASLVRKLAPIAGVSPSVFLGALGMPGLTAYAGLVDVAGLHAGDVVFVSGAAGAVGSLVGQIARRRGAARVIGSAGSDAKVRHLVDVLGFDAAFNYKSGPVGKQLREAAPDGIDVYFDNVGGDHLEAAIGAMKNHGRVALCGAISQYNAEAPSPGPRNLALAVGRRLTLRGFIVSDHNSLYKTFVGEVGGWLRDGTIRFDETVVVGIERAVDAFIGLLRGENTGKMVVKLA